MTEITANCKMEKRVFDTPKETARGFAEYLLESHKSADKINIALSGGSTPKILFDLISDEYEGQFDWSKIHLYWGDERCVPPTDEQSNYKMTVDHLISKIDIPDVNIHRVLGENDPAEEAIRYGNEITKNLPIKAGLPCFDIVLLGMGGDGHTASIFPHEMGLMTDSRVCAIGINPDSGQNRVTLTGPVINNAESICFLATGKGKAEKVDEIFNQKEGYLDYPASQVHPTHGQLYWFLDNEAIQKSID